MHGQVFEHLDVLTLVLGNYKMMMFVAPLVPGKVRICFTVAQLLPWICCPGAGASLALAANPCQWLTLSSHTLMRTAKLSWMLLQD